MSMGMLSKMTPAEKEIYEAAHFYFVDKNTSFQALEEQLNKFIASSQIDEKDVFLALKILQVHPDTQKLYFLGYLMFLLELPPFWELTFDAVKDRSYFGYKVMSKEANRTSSISALH